MKNPIALFLALFTTCISQAQVGFYIEAGPQQSSAKEKNSLPGWDTAWKPFYGNRNSFSFGLGAEISLNQSNRLMLQSSLQFSGKGRSFSQSRSESSAILTDTMAVRSNLELNYMELPVLLAYKFPISNNLKIFIAGGVYLSFIYKGNQTDEYRIYSSKKYTKTESSIETGNSRNKYKNSDYGLVGKFGLEAGKISFSAFSETGLSSFHQADYITKINHQVVGLKLAYNLGEPAKYPVKDQDGDGLMDEADACPLEMGKEQTSGCPDEDNDGIADKIDKCPKIKGIAKYGGCPIPDTDQDGVNDENDQCPNQPGLIKYKGCPIPDSDSDGVDDEKDACPAIKGLQKYNGCPAPDKDQDGVEDTLDQCPDLSGPVSNFGCPILSDTLKKKFAAIGSQIFFNYKSDSLQESSNKALEELVNLMKSNLLLTLKIVGFTDNAGNPSSNLLLSQKRAETVKSYFLSKGIESSRIEAIGKGQADPIATNQTEKGRKLNRRVELLVEEKKN